MRVFTALLMHESSSFSPIATDLQSYRDYLLYEPGVDEWNPVAETMDSQADFVRLARQGGHQLMRGLMADTAPGRPAPLEVYEQLRDRILGQLQAALPVDMVLLTLHGAQSADGCDDCEGDLLERVRALVGPDVVVAANLDLHFNLTQRMVDNASVINACLEYPHTDVSARAGQLFGIAERAARGEIDPVMEWCPVPLLGQFFTTREPMRGLVDLATRLEGEPGVLSVSLGHGFPHADTCRTSASTLVVTDGDRTLARRLAAEMADRFFAVRDEIRVPLAALHDLPRLIRAAARGPVVVADGSDNPGGGAPCDSTFVLRELLSSGVRDAVIAWIVDPEAVRAAFAAGVGADVILRVGGRHGAVSGMPVEARMTVLCTVRAFTQIGLGCSPDTDLGDVAVVRTAGIDVVLVSRRNQHFGPESLQRLGIDVASRRAIVVKSSQHFFTRYAGVAGEIIYVDAPGALTQRFTELPFRRLERPLWPLDSPPFVSRGRAWPATGARG